MSNEYRNNITQLNNDYTSQYNQQQSLKQKRRTYLKRRLMMLLAVGFVILIIPTVSLVKNYLQVREINAAKEESQEELVALENYQSDLEYYIDLLNDEEYVAKLARSEYYLSKEDEVIFNLPEDYIPDHQRVIEEFHQEESEDTN